MRGLFLCAALVALSPMFAGAQPAVVQPKKDDKKEDKKEVPKKDDKKEVPKPAEEGPQKTKVPEIAKDILAKADEWELYSITKPAEREKPKDERFGWKVLGKMTLKDSPERKKLLAELLLSSLNKTILDIGDTFEPSVDIHVLHEGKILDVVIGFGSGRANVYLDGKPAGFFALGQEPQKDFEKTLTDAKVPLVSTPKPPEPLPGFPNIQHTSALLEVMSNDSKPVPLLKIVNVEYNKDKKEITWLLQAQNDITYEDYLTIRKAWQSGLGSATSGPTAHFFDARHVKLYKRDLKEVGELRNAKKGDSVALILETGDGFPNAAFMELRRP